MVSRCASVSDVSARMRARSSRASSAMAWNRARCPAVSCPRSTARLDLPDRHREDGDQPVVVPTPVVGTPSASGRCRTDVHAVLPSQKLFPRASTPPLKHADGAGRHSIPSGVTPAADGSESPGTDAVRHDHDLRHPPCTVGGDRFRRWAPGWTNTGSLRRRAAWVGIATPGSYFSDMRVHPVLGVAEATVPRGTAPTFSRVLSMLSSMGTPATSTNTLCRTTPLDSEWAPSSLFSADHSTPIADPPPWWLTAWPASKIG